MAKVEFFFDFASPWTYLGFTRLREAAMRTAANIVWKPMRVDRVLAAANPDYARCLPAADSAKGRYQRKDLQDWAWFCGVTIRQPSRWSADASLPALRGAVALAKQPCMADYVAGIFAAWFADDRDIMDAAIVTGVAAAAGADAEEFAAVLSAPETLARVTANADELVRRGGFGSPTFFVGDAMYFGNDRLPLVELALRNAGEMRFIAPGAHGQGL